MTRGLNFTRSSMLQHTVQPRYMVGEIQFYGVELDGGLALFDTGTLSV